MHRAAAALLFPLGLAALATAADPAPRSLLSDRLAAELRATLPKFDPAAAEAQAKRAEQPEPPADPDVIVLPRMVIRERRLPRTEPDDWLTREALQRKIKNDYLASMDGLTGILNSWSIPLVTPSVAARANARYRAQKLREEVGRLNSIGDALKTVDPNAAAELRDEISRALTGRPPASRK